ncbi:2-phosphosulfolactate phosphatase [Nocardioides alcanivorans]|uniref:2-phosphosulfolactate phosphatase n=1 Tax=Nocardioides alcanivorans TaxID=2897352 RepID=UPI001F3CD49A|nr:2-phosphosulfolactate phosphatase [Nocardioides alcanivorans]
MGRRRRPDNARRLLREGSALPEARLAADAFNSASARLEEEMLDCASGRELVERGFAEDVRMAAARDASSVVPHLVGTSFVSAPAG